MIILHAAIDMLNFSCGAKCLQNREHVLPGSVADWLRERWQVIVRARKSYRMMLVLRDYRQLSRKQGLGIRPTGDTRRR
jgi:hypothetical protein